MLQIIFGDDEHTAEEGCYSRLLKARKWLYLSATALLLVEHDLYRPEAALALLPVIRLPAPVLATTFFLGTAYMSATYLLLLGQLRSTYDLTMEERLASRRMEEITAAADRVRSAEEERAALIEAFRVNATTALGRQLASAVRERDEVAASLAAATEHLQRLNLEPPDLASPDIRERGAADYTIIRLRASLRKLEERIAALKEGVPGVPVGRVADDPAMVATAKRLATASAALDALQKKTPANRVGYKQLERWIDVVRLFPPIVLGLYAAVLHVF